ncbi:15242_t:CDS:2 [Dentiscutata heterogama]|uniref:15242_t:CDS:1 n=1 Tax=Dentiscutata heterogama TaxID=1316150 RepID=A0ACA9MZV4_9GLOM|nr:15242_t:CDS:2 [Dentiscutata heterogama]
MREKLIKKIVLSIDPVTKEFKLLYQKICEYFDNFRCTFNKDMTALAKDLLVKNYDPTDENIEQFIASKIAVHNKEKPSYSENVLTKIKKLNQFTLHITIPLQANEIVQMN